MRLYRHLFHADLTLGLAGLALVALSLVVAPTADAAGGAGDGSDWGPQGSLVSTSAATATWDNHGNAADSIVPRDQSQVVPHTGGKTYADIPQASRDAYASYFGASNGLGGLKVSVSQTQSLVNQSVTVHISGAKANIAPGTTNSASYFQVFQCWGAPKSDGTPDPNASSPDPATCQFGAPGVGGDTQTSLRTVFTDPLLASSTAPQVPGADWQQYNQFIPAVVPPFETVDGKKSGIKPTNDNTFFSTATTNELDQVFVPTSGTTDRQFEMQTVAQSAGLGCGHRDDQPTTPTCWLVVVPRIANTGSTSGVGTNLGATSPSIWAQRLQFKLGFQNAATTCSQGTSQSLLGGSELLAIAAGSWTPGICDAAKVTLGYNKLSDQVARTSYDAKQSNAILTSDAVGDVSEADVVPLALTAPVVAYNLSYRPACQAGPLTIDKVTTDAQAKTCGYADLNALKADLDKAGEPVTDLHLDALLVAKLLTMSYSQSLIQNSSLPEPAWASRMPTTLTADPRFLELNPQLHLLPSNSDIASMVLEFQRSDAASHIWQWLDSDPAAHSFLSGCPDAHGLKINPFFSSRGYDGCAAQASQLATQAQDEIAHTNTPANFTASAQTYPPDTAAYPLPQWQQTPPGEDSLHQPILPLTLVDWLPRVTDMSVGARDAYFGIRPRNDTWCSYAETTDQTCLPKPGKWKSSPGNQQKYGQRQVFTITDAASAARYQLPTASLCDDTGAHCVGASTASLQAAAADFQPSTVAGFAAPATAPDYAGGAYPLALPVYGVVRTSLPAATRAPYAAAFTYITTTGQQPGYEAGALPPGYAPLPSALVAQAAASIRDLTAADPVGAAKVAASLKVKPTKSKTSTSKPSASASASASVSPTPTSASSGGGGTLAGGPSDAPGGGGPKGSAGPSAAAASSSAAATVATVPVAASTESWPSWVLPLGVGLALGAGAAGPFLRRRSTVRLR